jgi:hypothetical protein
MAIEASDMKSREAPMRFRTVATALLLASAIGCLTAAQRREEDLIRETRIFNDDFRWGRWEMLGQSMTPEENALFQARKNLVDTDLVIVDYEITSVRFLQNSEAAVVDVHIEWYKKSDPSVRLVTLQQRWELRNGHWMMMKQRRVRGDRFPLVPEQVAEKPLSVEPAAAPLGGATK